MREIRRRLGDLKKENEELKNLLALSGKNRHEYETKVIHPSPNNFVNLSLRIAQIQQLEINYSECLDKLHRSQLEVNHLQQRLLQTSPSSSMTDLSPHRHTVFLSPVEYANFMGIENSLKSELEEILEDPNQLCPSNINTEESLTTMKKLFRRRTKRDPSDTDGESTMNDSAFSDTESLSRYESSTLHSACVLVLSPA